MGFNYTTISAKVGIAVKTVYDVAVSTASTVTQYFFTSPVEYASDGFGFNFTPVGQNVTLANNQTYLFRPVDPNATSVGVFPISRLSLNVNAKLDLQAALESHVRLLELNGHGIDAGPLFRDDRMLPIGSIGSFRTSTVLQSGTALQPFRLDFLAAGGPAPRLASISNIGALGADGIEPSSLGERGFLFIPSSGDREHNNESGAVFLVINFGADGCDDFSYDNCVADPDFEPVPVARFASIDADGNTVYTFSTSFQDYNDILNLEEGAYGEQTSDEQLLASLQFLPPRGSDYSLPDQIAFNTTPWVTNAVPEPASWALMIAGLGLTGAAMRRRAKVRAVLA